MSLPQSREHPLDKWKSGQRQQCKTTNMHWSDIVDGDLDGEEFINFLGDTADMKQWGGAR
eukprot:7608336-Heterocapsa_arctica.AAC.1